MCSSVPECMILFYKESQPAYNDMERWMNDGVRKKSFCKFSSILESVEDMKDILEMFPKDLPKIVVFDDFLDEVGTVLKHFFTVLTHHYNCLTIFLCQNLFSAKSKLRTLSINLQYMILFNNPRDRSAISHLAKQVFPGNVHQLNDAYMSATKATPYGYLLLDFQEPYFPGRTADEDVHHIHVRKLESTTGMVNDKITRKGSIAFMCGKTFNRSGLFQFHWVLKRGRYLYPVSNNSLRVKR